MTGLREQKKAKLGRAIVETTVRHMVERGYGETTVDGIAAELDISARTFFRYFPSKDDAALAILSGLDDRMAECFAQRPEGEPVLPALTAALSTAWRELWGEQVNELHLTFFRLVDDVPALFAANARRDAKQRESLVTVAKQRGMPPELASLAVAAFEGAFHVAVGRWRQSGGESVEELLRHVRRCVAKLPQAIGG